MLNIFFSANGDGSYGFTPGGYAALAVIFFLIIVGVAMLGSHQKTISTKQIAFSAVAMALAFVTSNLKVLHMPMGGSVTLFSMFFITLIGYLYGPVIGIMVGVAYGLLQMVIDPYIISLPQMLVDYPLAFGALGISGFFCNKRKGLITGYAAGVLGRYFFAVLSGVIFFGMYAPENMGPFVYSLAYNGAYLGLEAAITIALLLVPAVYKGIAQVKEMAQD